MSIILKITLPMMLTIFFVGCGGDDDKKVLPEEINYPDPVNNEGNPVNLLGYYGDNVYLGDQKIVGEWRAPGVDQNGSVAKFHVGDSSFWFYGDGTGEYKDNQISSGGPRYFTYGFQRSWDIVLAKGTVDNTLMPMEVFNVIGYKDGCFKIKATDVTEIDSPELDSNPTPFFFCKVK